MVFNQYSCHNYNMIKCYLMFNRREDGYLPRIYSFRYFKQTQSSCWEMTIICTPQHCMAVLWWLRAQHDSGVPGEQNIQRIPES